MEMVILNGTWEVVSDSSGIVPKPAITLEGVKFTLDWMGDVAWNVSDDLKSIPLFWCDTYEVDSNIVRFGAYAGNVIEFYMEPSYPQETLILKCEGWCTLHCRRLADEPSEKTMTLPFVLVNLGESYLTDITITASNDKKFKVHKSILRLLSPDIPWESEPPPLEGIKEDVITTILHYLYTECLPKNLKKEDLVEVRDVSKQYPCLKNLIELCEMYYSNMVLEEQMKELIDNIQSRIDRIIENFSSGDLEFIENPSDLCAVIKQSMRDVAIIASKLLVLCDTFSKRKSMLTNNDSERIINYVKLRLPNLFSQIERLLDVLKRTFNRMTAVQRKALAMYLVPEVASGLNLLVVLTIDVETKLSEIVNSLLSQETLNEDPNSENELAKSLKEILRRKEIVKLSDIHYQIKKNIPIFMDLQSGFNAYTANQKTTATYRNLDYLIEELRSFLVRLDEVKATFLERLETKYWSEFKYSFKLATTEVSGVLQQLVIHKSIVSDFIQALCNIVQRDDFTKSFKTLGLLDVSESTGEDSELNEMEGNAKEKLNLLESLCKPPPPMKSAISKAALQLLRSGDGSDMVFEVVNSSESEAAETPEEMVVIPAHRVIMASRCVCFRKALMSGMKETIERKIVIHDSNPQIFRVFLEYLYGGTFQPSQLNNEQLSELLLLSDRYELNPLKATCEYSMELRINTGNVMYFFGISDQFNAATLKQSCLNYISRNHEFITRESYYKLPDALQVEVLQHIMATKKPTRDDNVSVVARRFSGLWSLQNS